MPFDGFDAPVPADCDAYLRRKFGDYMRLPDLDTIHSVRRSPTDPLQMTDSNLAPVALFVCQPSRHHAARSPLSPTIVWRRKRALYLSDGGRDERSWRA